MFEVKSEKIKTNIPAQEEDMQIDDFDKHQVINLIKEANTIAIVPSKIAGADSYAAGAGLYLMLKEKFESSENEATKMIRFVYAGNIPENCNELLRPEEISTNLSDRELLITVDYSNTPAAKVQYSTENEVLHLKIGPVPKNFEHNRIRSRITGFDFDLVITIGAQELADLGQIYNNLRGEINQAQKINIDNSSNNKRFGIVNIIDPSADSLSTLVFQKASEWKLVPNKKSAKALLVGMTYRDRSIKQS